MAAGTPEAVIRVVTQAAGIPEDIRAVRMVQAMGVLMADLTDHRTVAHTEGTAEVTVHHTVTGDHTAQVTDTVVLITEVQVIITAGHTTTITTQAANRTPFI